jgi:hypothetical protein
VAENIAQQLEKRVMYRRAVKRVLGNATRLGAQGIKVMVSGRLNGAEIARSCDICRQLASQFHQSSPYDPLPSRGCDLSSFF